MKRYLAIFGFVFIGVIAGLIVRGIPIVLQVNAGGGIQADRNGDVNGDARLDMSDAVYLLLHIFRDGPQPVAFADSPETAERLNTLERTISELETSADELVMHAICLAQLTYTCNDINGCSGQQVQGAIGSSSLTRGTITEEGTLVFTTNRTANLLISLNTYPPAFNAGAWISLILNDEHNLFNYGLFDWNGVPYATTREVVLNDIPSGTHVLKVTFGLGQSQNRQTRSYRGDFNIKVTYLPAD